MEYINLFIQSIYFPYIIIIMSLSQLYNIFFSLPVSPFHYTFHLISNCWEDIQLGGYKNIYRIYFIFFIAICIDCKYLRLSIYKLHVFFCKYTQNNRFIWISLSLLFVLHLWNTDRDKIVDDTTTINNQFMIKYSYRFFFFSSQCK